MVMPPYSKWGSEEAIISQAVGGVNCLKKEKGGMWPETHTAF
jgi:hypothetical protein